MNQWICVRPRRRSSGETGSPTRELSEGGCVAHPWTACERPPPRARPLSQMVRARACVVAPCVTLSYAGLCDPQEEDSAPPRPPLPQSYEPVPPTVPPLPSRANIRPSSLYRPEERKVSSRNGTASVSSLTRGPLGRPTVLSSCHCLL